MAKTIKVEWNAEDIAEIVRDWLGKGVSKAQAERIIAKIKRRAEDGIAQAGFAVISGLIERI